MTFSGGLRGVLLDQAAAHGLSFAPLAAKTRKRLGKLLGVGTVIGNPLDSGFGALSSRETYIRCVEALVDDPGIDTLLLQEELLRAPEGGDKENNMRAVNELAARAKKPIAFVTMISHGLNDYARDLRDGLRNVAFLQEADKSLRTVRSVISYAARLRTKAGAQRRDRPAVPVAVWKVLERAGGAAGPTPLSEIDSKTLLRAYGLRTPRERLAGSAAEAARIGAMGFPVVLKAAGAELTHKSDAGGVLLNNGTVSAVRQGYGTILRNVARKAKGIALDGVLVAEQVAGELELVIGASRDPEMGTMVMFGSGGVALELYSDVAFAAPTLDEALIARTRAARLIEGYRGAPALDRKALVKVLMVVSRLACDLGDGLESIDVNPFVLRRRGGIARDALVVLAGAGRDSTGPS